MSLFVYTATRSLLAFFATSTPPVSQVTARRDRARAFNACVHSKTTLHIACHPLSHHLPPTTKNLAHHSMNAALSARLERRTNSLPAALPQDHVELGFAADRRRV